MEDFKHAIVITGGIGTGKSTVCSLLRLYGFTIIDADAITRELLDKHPDKITELFGSEFVSVGKVDRRALGDFIFANKDERKKLEEFLHPLIKDEIKQKSSLCISQNIPFILDIPLYFENKNYEVEEVAVVYATREQQLTRVLQRSDVSKRRVENILDIQMDIEEKKKKATYVIDNTKNLKHLQSEVEKFVTYIKEKYAHLKI